MPGWVLGSSNGSDTESMGGSEASGEVEPESVPEPEVACEGFRANSAAIRVAFQGLDAVELPLIFNRRVQIMKNIPYFLRGAFQELPGGQHPKRGWKLFMLLPRMLLHQPPRGGNIPRHKLQERFNAFGLGQWASLIQQAIESTEIVAVAQRRGQHQRGDDVGKRAERSQSFVLVGELSLGRQALEGEAVAPDRGNVEFVGGC